MIQILRAEFFAFRTGLLAPIEEKNNNKKNSAKSIVWCAEYSSSTIQFDESINKLLILLFSPTLFDIQ